MRRTLTHSRPTLDGGRSGRGCCVRRGSSTGTTVTRVDPSVEFDWGTAAPVSGIRADTFSVRWSGSVVPRYSQTYTFATTSDDGVQLWVDGRLVIDAWTNHARRVDTGTVTLTAGQAVPIVLEYFDGVGHAVAQLRWSSTSQVASR